MDTPKLSEAMRAGAKLRPQVKGFFFRRIAAIGVSSCALGAAWEGATGALKLDLMPSELIALWPNLEADNDALLEEIQTMNDGLGYTREQIADWLETQGL